MATVKVAVRVRPFNQRELNMDSRLIIEMDGKKTRISNPKISMSCHQGDIGRDRFKEFIYDYSYWSVNGTDPHYASQEEVFDDLGTKVVDSAFEGYNACTFAYGQTGSGKTHTMMGSENEVGLIPRICETLFARMQQSKDDGITFRTEVSYLEIYNEKVKDLLKKDTQQHSLRLREHPKLGPYVQDLSKHLVMDYHDVEELMKQGNSIRTTAATKMNDTSSRSHAIFTLTFVQAKFDRDMPIETVSKIHLVDLAGSERADTSGATGERLKEGGHINKSLVTLGSVISALADISTSTGPKSKQVFIPYRDSVLTWLLKDSLGGNAKTIMIATISPADCNYGETLSTLRYANRAKNIINKPRVNEDPNVKLIRELKAEIAKLKGLLDGSQTARSSTMVEKLHQNEARVKMLTEEWTERWRETQKILQEQKALGLRKSGIGVILDSDRPHLIGIDDDVLSTGITLYHLKESGTSIGSTDNEGAKRDIVLNGIGIEPEHCIINLDSGTATLVPIGQALCFVDGLPVDKPTKLSQGCVILLGRTNMFRYNDPAEAAKLRKEKKGSDATRLRMSFLSWSMPDLANSIDNSLAASPSSKRSLALVPEVAGDPISRMTTSNGDIEERLVVDAEHALDAERKTLHDRWEMLYDREKLLLEAIDKVNFGDEHTEERRRLDAEQEEIEVEQARLEHAEERLDNREAYLCDVRRRMEAATLVVPAPEECRSVDADVSVTPEDDVPQSLGLDENLMQLDVENSLQLQGIPVDDRIRELVEQEVQRHLLKKMASELEELRTLRERAFLGNCSSSGFYRAGRSVSAGNLGKADEEFSVTIPSFILRGAGSATHHEYEVRVVVRNETWTIFRRYRRFRELHLRMKQKYGSQIKNLYFPPKSFFRTRSEKLVRERQAHLERYLQQLIDTCLRLPACPLSAHTYETLTKQVICDQIPFLRKGLFEVGKHGTA